MAQLIRVSTKEILWRVTIDVKYDQFPAVHNRVAREVIRGLRLRLPAQEAENTDATDAAEDHGSICARPI